MPWIDAVAPEAPFNVRVEDNSLVWDIEEDVDEMNKARFYVVYRYDLGESRYLKRVENICAVTGNREYTWEGGATPGIYRISSLDRLHNESQLSRPIAIIK